MVFFEVASDVIRNDNGDDNDRGRDGGLEKKRGMQVPEIEMKQRRFFMLMFHHGMVFKKIFAF
jgi:hypothetical protein